MVQQYLTNVQPFLDEQMQEVLSNKFHRDVSQKLLNKSLLV
ncbi:MAG: hypothetical protein NZZ41_02885 [Candidatus Dojkabacteria bacterium]|nr:hypothetical protein [Candidatus Dojkabacteria bacterium]